MHCSVLPRRVPTRADVRRVLATAAVAVVAVALVLGRHGQFTDVGRPELLAPVLLGVLCTCAPLLAGSAAPVTVVLVLAAADLVNSLGRSSAWLVPLGYAGDVPWRTAVSASLLVAVGPALFGVARRRSVPLLLVSIAAVAAPGPVAAALLGPDGRSGPSLVLGFALGTLLVGAVTAPAWVVGVFLRRGAERRESQEREVRELAARVLQEERMFIARELRGLVLADLGRIADLAGGAAARGRDERGVDEARMQLREIADGGRTTLTTMRRLLDVLRASTPSGAHAAGPGARSGGTR